MLEVLLRWQERRILRKARKKALHAIKLRMSSQDLGEAIRVMGLISQDLIDNPHGGAELKPEQPAPELFDYHDPTFQSQAIDFVREVAHELRMCAQCDSSLTVPEWSSTVDDVGMVCPVASWHCNNCGFVSDAQVYYPWMAASLQFDEAMNTTWILQLAQDISEAPDDIGIDDL